MRRELRLAILLGAISVLADLLPADEYTPIKLYQPASSDEVTRSGWPWCQWKWAQIQNSRDYSGYYVGGGAPGPPGREHCRDQGTWGWDYEGQIFHRRVRLGWTDPSRRQGGQGSYSPDGPRVIETIHEPHDAKLAN